MRPGLVVGLCFIAACGDNSQHGMAVFDWSGERTPGSLPIDHAGPMDPQLFAAMDDRADDDWVAMFYGHYRDDHTRFDTLEALLAHAVADDLPFLTFADLAAGGPPRHGVCISFDDADYSGWAELRELFARYHARVTFFITRYPYALDEDRALLHVLAADGHDIEAHGVNHVDSPAYVAEFGLDMFMANEVQPSIDVLRADGFAPVAYAHPFGATTPEIEDAILQRVQLVRRISTLH